MLNYYTVTEYSKTTGKDPGNIRRMLLNGKIAGEKIGNQWVIPKDTVYPGDKRLKSGNYRNWRQKNAFSKAQPVLMKALKKMCLDFQDIYGEYIYQVVLYGSYARGEQTPDSDVDIALLLRAGNTEDMHDKMVDLVVDLELELALTLSVVPLDLGQYTEWKTTLPFYRNIDKDGILLWTAA